MAMITRGVRMDERAFQQLERLARICRKTQGHILAVAIKNAYAQFKADPEYAPWLVRAEQDDERAAKEEPARRRRAVVIKLDPEEAVKLAIRAIAETGDPRDAERIGREILRQHLHAERMNPSF